MTPRTTTALLRRHVDGLRLLTSASPDGRVVRAGSLVVADAGIDVAAFNGIQVTGAAWSVGDLRRAAGFAASMGRPWSVTVQQGSGTARDAARLDAVERVAERHGLTDRDEAPFMVCAPEDFPADGTPAGTASSVHVDTVSAEDRDAYTAAVAAGFGVPAETFGTVFGGGLLDDPMITGYLVRSAARTIGSGLAVRTGDAVGVHNIAVLAGDRRKGAGRAVTARVARDGFAAGARAAYLLSSVEGLPLYRSLGFREADTLVRWSTPDNTETDPGAQTDPVRREPASAAHP